MWSKFNLNNMSRRRCLLGAISKFPVLDASSIARCIPKTWILSSRRAISTVSLLKKQSLTNDNQSSDLSSQQRCLSTNSKFDNFINDISNNSNRTASKTSSQPLGNIFDQADSSGDFLSPEASLKTAQSIQRGWESGQLEFNERVLKLYIKALSGAGMLDAVNISSLLALSKLSKEGESKGSENAQLLSAMLQANSNAGRDPSSPLYIVNVPPRPTMKDRVNAAFKALLTAASLYLLYMILKDNIDISFDSDKSGKPNTGGGGGGNPFSKALGMPKSIVRQAETSDKTFADVVGIDEAKADLEEIVWYLKDPQRFTRLGGKLPKGVLLTGPPGTGKTLLARAIAGEAKVPFFYASGSEFEEMFVGLGARRVRELFAAAKENSPCIIFIDEIDAMGGSRHLKDQSSLKMTLNQLLVEMDGFIQNTGIIVIGATNFADSLDSALIRPGRFDKIVSVPMPDIGGRLAILKLYTSKVPLSKDVNLEVLARGTPGFSGAELYNLVNHAAIRASLEGLKSIGMTSFEQAKDKILMGAEMKSAIISPENMKLTAFHEAGHALVALLNDASNPVHKVTIIPRANALGYVMQLPDGDQKSMSLRQMMAQIDVSMGGRVAEELVFGHENITSGAVSDIENATKIATAMVTRFGLSNKLGMQTIGGNFKTSDDTQRIVDEEVRDILNQSYDRVKKILTTRRKDLDTLANGLLEYETLSGSEIAGLLNGVKPNTLARSERPSRESAPIKTIGVSHAEIQNKQQQQQNVVPTIATAAKKTSGGIPLSPPSTAGTVGKDSSNSNSHKAKEATTPVVPVNDDKKAAK